jgi:hypothetical protein
VIETAKTTLFVAAKHERCPAVRTVFIHHTNFAVRVSENHEIFSEDAGFDGCPIWLGDLFD